MKKEFSGHVPGASTVNGSSGSGSSSSLAAAESYHGQVLERDSDDEGQGGREESLADWHVGKLRFKKHIDDKYRMGVTGSDGRNMDDYTVCDPRSERQL